jgi:hypothetical protein
MFLDLIPRILDCWCAFAADSLAKRVDLVEHLDDGSVSVSVSHLSSPILSHHLTFAFDAIFGAAFDIIVNDAVADRANPCAGKAQIISHPYRAVSLPKFQNIQQLLVMLSWPALDTHSSPS